MILAFVGGVTLRPFGATIYVANVVTVAMLRELGAVMTGIVMAGRTGSAYAAQLGTMKVTQEIDALTTMAVPTSDFLVLPAGDRAVAHDAAPHHLRRLHRGHWAAASWRW